jgi:aminotransferase
MCAPTVSQFAALEAINNGDNDVAVMREEYNRRRRYIVAELRELGLDCFEAEGAFYVYPNISKFGMSSEEFCRRLLNEKGVAIVPGTAFGEGCDGYARISYAYSVDHISKALSRIKSFISEL